MLVSADVKGLEVVTVAWLANDETLRQEIKDGIDIHGANQAAFNLPDRLTAKRFKFKMIYGGTDHGFAVDPDLSITGFSKKKWGEVIEQYYSKYHGIARWHKEIIDRVLSTGFLESPSGRMYDYRALLRKPDWDYIPKIKNYPVQGLGADLVKLARIMIFKKWRPEYGKLVNTIHDSVVLDSPKDSWYNISMMVENVFKELPFRISKIYKINWDLPINVEFKQLNGEEIEFNR